MVEGFLLALVATLANGLLGVFFELAGKRRYNIFEFMLYKQGLGFLFGLAFTLTLHLPLLNARLFLLGLIGAITYLVTLGAYLQAARERDIGANWTVINLSVALPILFSVAYFHDHLTAMKGIGLALVVVAVVVIGGGLGSGLTLRLSPGWAQWIAIAFLMNGWLATLFRFVPKESASVFTLYFYGLSFLMILPRKLFARSWPSSGLVWVCLGGAATHWTGVVLTIVALDMIGKVNAQAGLIVYPITNGLVVPVGVVLGALLLRQHISGRARLGIACGVAALVCLSL